MEKSFLGAYAAINKNEYIRMDSSSGGIFSLFCEWILSHLQGVVYGVSMSSDCEFAEFVRVDKLSDIHKIRGSKYIQAVVGDTYRNVKKDLENNTYVLFSGTPCQIEGLKMFLGKEYSNLYCVDLICHGVPSPLIWRKYKEYLYEQYKEPLVDVKFRCKDKSWSGFGMKEQFRNYQMVFISKEKDPYMIMFLKNLALRPSCYNCKAKKNYMSDITIADFWGINKVVPQMDDNKGTSAVITRSEKGKLLFENICSQIIFRKVEYKDIVKYNPTEYESILKPVNREDFFEDSENMDFLYLIDKYCKPDKISFIVKCKRLIKCILNKILRGGRR